MKSMIKIIKIKFYLLILLIIVFCPYNLTAQEKNTTEMPAESQPKDTQVLVDLDLKDVDIKDVARALSHLSGKNILVSEEVKVKVTLRLKDVDWRTALDMILKAYNLTVIEEKDYIIITTFEKRRQAEERGDLRTEVISFNFVDVEAVKKTLSSMLTSRGRIETDMRTNSLVITDISERIEKIKQVASQLDTKTPQVMIESVMLTVRVDESETLGIDWTITHKDVPERKFELKEAPGKNRGLDLRYGKTVLSWADFSTLIECLCQERKADILANPRILTLDNLTAKIDLIERVPYTKTTETDQGAVTSTDFKDVGINLYVKPHITKDNYIFMTLYTEQSYVSGWTGDGQPIIDTRKAETTVMVRDGETIVIGGLRKKQETKVKEKLPILGDIPIIGNFFRMTDNTLIDTDLLIFVTPYISTDLKITEEEAKELQRGLKKKGQKKDSSSQQHLPGKPSPFPLRPPLLSQIRKEKV